MIWSPLNFSCKWSLLCCLNLTCFFLILKYILKTIWLQVHFSKSKFIEKLIVNSVSGKVGYAIWVIYITLRFRKCSRPNNNKKNCIKFCWKQNEMESYIYLAKLVKSDKHRGFYNSDIKLGLYLSENKKLRYLSIFFTLS